MRYVPQVAVTLAAIMTLATLGVVLVPRADEIRAPWAVEPPIIVQAGEEPHVKHAKALLVEATEVLHVDLIEKLHGALETPRGDALVALDGPAAKTLYLHSTAPAGQFETAGEFAGATPGPTMDETEPTGAASKALLTGPANNNFRKNFLTAYWGANVHGIMKDVSLTLHVQALVANEVEVTLFGDGPIGVSIPAARKSLPISPGGPVALTFDFAGAEIRVEQEMVVSVISRSGLSVPGVATVPSSVSVLYDSATHPSALSFTLHPLAAPGPKLDDPAGIAFRAGKTLVANAGDGSVLELDGAAAPVRVASGYFPAGFTRGLGDMVSDADGNVYFSETDTGRVHFLTPGGATGVYAEGLGAPRGLAFNDAGDLFVGDSGAKRVLKVAPDRSVTTLATLPGAPYDIALAPNGTLTVSTFRPGTLYTVDAVSGDVWPLVTLGTATTAEGIAYDEAGGLWIGSNLNNTIGRLLRLAPDLTLALVNDTLGGPLHLAFIPGSSSLVVATQGLASALGDAVLTFATPDAGLALAAPSLAPTPIAAFDGWVHLAGGRTMPAASYAGALPTGAVRDVGRDPAEPTLGIQADGDIFTVAASSAESMFRNPLVTGAGEPAVMRSRDNGTTWEIVSPRLAGINDPPTTVDPFVYVDPDTDRVFTFDLTGACQYLSYSDDSGESWTTNRLACGVPPVDHQSIVAARPRTVQTNGYPNVLYHCTNWVAISPCGRSLDGGDTWSPAGVAFIGALDPETRCPASGGLLGHLGSDLDGRVYVGKPLCGKPYVAISEDDGLTWKRVLLNDTVGIVGHDIDFAVDAANNMYAMWLGADLQPYYVASTDHGATWGPARAVSPTPIRETRMPAIAAGDEGRVVFSYIGTGSAYGYAANDATKTAWNAFMTYTLDALADEPVFVTINPHPIQDPIARGTCERPCGGIWDFLDVRVGPDGRAWAAFVDSCVAACSTDRTAPVAQFGNEFLGAIATGPRLRGGGALVPL